MAIQLSQTLSSNEDVERKILSDCDLQTVVRCSSVCTLWQKIINDDDFLRQILSPELQAIAGTHIKDLLSHAVTSESGILIRFEKHLKKLDPSEEYLFACYFPFHPDNDLCIRITQQARWKEVCQGPEIEKKGIDYCVFINLLPQPQKEVQEEDLIEIVPHGSLEYIFTGNFSDSFHYRMMDIMEEHEYPLATLMYMKSHRIMSDMSKKISQTYNNIPSPYRPIAAGTALASTIALGAFACYKYFRR